MSLSIDVLEEKKNPLINRTEITFRIDHFSKSTPNRLEVKKKISEMKNSKEELTIIKKISSHFGASYSVGKVYVYNDVKDLKHFEPFHIRVRNLPKEKRNEIYKLKKKKEACEHLFEY
ncbi:MAG: 30S ribosomal protein S24e [Candidatus Lokiarchaeota archaeon]|nr:30S ribosomal protein S24e [Candidatus Lokiarchaeota archaeon]